MEKIIFGFVGEIASGKGTACDYLIKKYSSSYHRYSSILRDVMKRLHLEESRENMQKLSTTLRETFSQDLFAKVMAEDVKNDINPIICLDGIRRIEDITPLMKLPEFVLISVEADLPTRFTRLKNRQENTDDQNKTIKQFIKEQENETEKTIRQVAKQARERIDNNNGLDNLYRQIDILVEKYRGDFK